MDHSPYSTPRRKPRSGSVNLSTLGLTDRMDARFVLALQEHRAKVEALVARYPRKNLVEWVLAMPSSRSAWETIHKGRTTPRASVPSEIPEKYTPMELALYLVLAAADDEARQQASDELERADRAVKAHADMRKELESL